MQNNNSQKGVALIMIFLIVTIAIAIVLSVNAILLKKVNLLGDIGKSAEALSLAQIGEEKLNYYIENGGMCRLANNCPTDAQNQDGGHRNCNDVNVTPRAPGGCNPNTCSNCEVTFNSTENGNINTVSATITDCATFSFQSNAKLSNGTSRTITSTTSVGSGNNESVFQLCVGTPSL